MMLLKFVATDLRRLWLGGLVVVLLIAGATALGLAVNLQERALRLGSARAADKFDLVVGAPGSDAQLVLSSVFLQPAPLTLLPGSVLEKLSADPRVALAAPIGFGDHFEGRPIVGTSAEFVTDGGRAPLAEGRNLRNITDAVVGAKAGLALGASIKPMHGLAGEGGHVHTGIAYEVVGRMAATGTPWDRAILVPIEGVWRLHRLEGEEAQAHPFGAAVAHGAGDRHAEAAAEPGHIGPPWRGSPGVPAIFVKAKTIADAYRLRQAYRTEATLAVFPAEVLTRLFATLGDARAVLAAVAGATQGLVGAAIALVCAMHLAQRGPQLAALRAFGAPRAAIFGIVWAQVFSLVCLGVGLGLVLGWAAAKIFAAWLLKTSGISAPVAMTGADLGWAGALVAIAMAIALVPAVRAYRRPAAGVLRG